ncbi:MAG: DUF2589 domain-containing protein [Bacteroidota bacterium]
MKSLKTFFNEDFSRKNKAEIVEFLTELHGAIGPEAFAAVTDLDPASELPALKKDEMIAIVHNFRDAYQASWEQGVLSTGSKYFNSILELAAADDNLFRAQNNTVSSADFAAELGSIDFENLIGGPMDAAVKAQANASMSTVNFIKEVGFDRDETGKVTGLKMADFSFEKQVPDPEDASKTITEQVKIQVPFISILNVPSLRVETLDIDFNVKLNSTYKRDVTSSLGINANVSAGWGPVKMKVSASYRRSASTGVKVEKEYSMGVKVRATNDDLPAGLEKVLGLMSE